MGGAPRLYKKIHNTFVNILLGFAGGVKNPPGCPAPGRGAAKALNFLKCTAD